MTDRELAVRRAILDSFAASGLPPEVDRSDTLDRLADQHVVVLDGDGRIQMAHPFAGHSDGARVDADGRSWWGNCAWDGLGIVAALGLRDATVTSNGIVLRVVDGAVIDEHVFHVAVPAAEWWDDITFT